MIIRGAVLLGLGLAVLASAGFAAQTPGGKEQRKPRQPTTTSPRTANGSRAGHRCLRPPSAAQPPRKCRSQERRNRPARARSSRRSWRTRGKSAWPCSTRSTAAPGNSATPGCSELNGGDRLSRVRLSGKRGPHRAEERQAGARSASIRAVMSYRRLPLPHGDRLPEARRGVFGGVAAGRFLVGRRVGPGDAI